MTSQKTLSTKAQQVKVASRQGDGPASFRTDIAEAWVPLQGAGSDARMLLRLQGAQDILLPVGCASARGVSSCMVALERAHAGRCIAVDITNR